MPALATTNDLALRLGRTFTVEEEARAAALLDDASAAVRAYTGQQFTAGTATAERHTPIRGAVRLWQRPVNSITSVVDDAGDAVAYDTWFEGDRLVGFTTTSPVKVTYTYGYATIPPDVVAVVCQIAGRAFGMTADSGGVTQEAIGSYSYTVGAAAAAGPLGLLPAEREVLDRYRYVAGMGYLSAWI